MATNCYGFAVDIDVCVDGPLGNGSTANMQAFLEADGGFDETPSHPDPIGTQSGWDGSTVVFDDWTSGSFAGCDVLSSELTITLVGDNQVEVIIEIRVDNCPEHATSVGEQCGGPGPHRFIDTRLVTMGGGPCPVP